MEHAPRESLASRAVAWLDNPLTSALLHPRTLDDYIALVDATWARKELRARVTAVRIARDAVALELALRRAAPVAEGHIDLVATIDGRRTARCVRVESVERGRLTLRVERVAGCPVASWALESVRIGDLVVLERPDASAPLGSQLVFRRSGVRAPADSTLPILEQAERAGLSPVAGCRRGVCHRCACTLASGSVRNLRTGDVSSERGSVIRPCVSLPIGAVEVDL